MTMGMNGDMNAEQRLETLSVMLGELSDMVHDIKGIVTTLDFNVSELTKAVNAVEANIRLVHGAVHSLRERVGKIEELFSGPETIPAPRPEAVTQPDLPKPMEDS